MDTPKKDIDSFRKMYLAMAEFVDAWRLMPRAIVALFGYGVYGVTKWYMNLEPYVLEKCAEIVVKLPEADQATALTSCIVAAPTTQHTALVSAMFALAAAVFAFYSNNGRKWGTNGFVPWNKKPEDPRPGWRSEAEDKGGNGG